MTLPHHHHRPPRAACQTIPPQPRGGDQQGANQLSRRPLRGLRRRAIENPGMGDRIQRNTHHGRPQATEDASIAPEGVAKTGRLTEGDDDAAGIEPDGGWLVR